MPKFILLCAFLAGAVTTAAGVSLALLLGSPRPAVAVSVSGACVQPRGYSAKVPARAAAPPIAAVTAVLLPRVAAVAAKATAAPDLGGRVIPNMRGAAFSGLKLFAITPGGELARLGLKNGDLVRAIDGERLGEPEKALRLLNAVPARASGTLEITRRGAEVTLAYSRHGLAR
jgi:membrane-associated protease RseP (regulator of RpoE activity)